MNPITIRETSRAMRFELNQMAEGYQLMNEASRHSEPKPSFVGRARLFIGLALIRAGKRLSQQQITSVSESKATV